MNARDLTTRTARHRGMTLTELLVVVTVMVILIGTAVPLMRNGLEERRLREASRQFNTACMLAKGIAAETGRPAGIEIDTQSGSSAQQVFLTETPPPYVGDTTNARARILTGAGGTTATFDNNSGSFGSLVTKYDVVKFDYKGPWYCIVSNVPTTGPPFTVTIDVTGLPLPPLAVWLPYQVLRTPTKSSSMPLELPAGVVVDLTQSGFGLSGTDLNSTNPVIVMFQPDGSVGRVQVAGSAPVHPNDTIHFLLGKIERVGASSPDSNLEDNTCLWVSIGAQSGRVTTAENGWPPVWTGSTSYATGAYRLPTVPNGFCYVARTAGNSGSSEPTWPLVLGTQVTDGTVQWECCSLTESARQFAQSGQAMGGR
jgi:prepilin-type N-terminal cleavage/methylation domain-containing protein